jgi:hypothetical protein
MKEEDSMKRISIEQVDEGSQPIYGPSIAEQNGWVAITGDDIEEAIRQ